MVAEAEAQVEKVEPQNMPVLIVPIISEVLDGTVALNTLMLEQNDLIKQNVISEARWQYAWLGKTMSWKRYLHKRENDGTNSRTLRTI